METQVQQDLPMCRHPDRSRAYLVLRTLPDERRVQVKPTPELPRGGPAQCPSFGPAPSALAPLNYVELGIPGDATPYAN